MCGADDSTASSSAAATTPGPPSSSSSSPPATTRPPSSPPSPPPDYNVLSDYRVRGYMAFDSIQAGGADCASSFIVACASMGPIPLRQSGTSYLRIQPPSTGYAVVNRSIIACPDVAVPISSDGDGNNLQAAGVIPADSVFPALAPVTPFVITDGGSPNTLQLRAVQTQCIYQYSVRRRGGGAAHAAPAAPAQQDAINTRCHRHPSPAAHASDQLSTGSAAAAVDFSV